MNTKQWSPILAGLMIVALLIFNSLKTSKTLDFSSSEGVEVAQAIGVDLTDDQHRANMLIQTLPIDEFFGVLGPEVAGTLAPIALSPFFALTCLSGASLLSSMGVLPEGITDNIMMSTSSPLHNEAVFLGLLALTVLTSLPKLTTVSKTFAQAVDQLEGYSGIVAALAVQFLSTISLDDTSASQQVVVVYSAGVFTFSLHGLVSFMLMVFSAINIFVVNSVKFFFEVMVWVSPIPTVDAIFEAFNKAFTGLLLVVYLISPTAATVLNLLIFLVCLSMFAWMYRRVVYMRSVLADPILGWFAESVLRLRKVGVNSAKLPRSIFEELNDPSVVIKGFAGKKMKGIKKKNRGFLVHSDGQTYFVRPRLVGKNNIQNLTPEGVYAEVRSGLLSHSVVFFNSNGEMTQKILFTRRYSRILQDIHRGLNARGSSIGSASDSMSGFGNAVKSARRSDLKSEFA